VSVSAVRWVLEHSRSTYGARLVLLVIAEHAHDNEAWPSIPGIAKRANMTERNVFRALRQLEALEELVIKPGGGPRGCNLYRIPDVTPDKMSPRQDVTPDISDPVPLTSATPTPDKMSPEPLVEPSKNLKAKNVGDRADPIIRPDVIRLCELLADGIQQTTGERPKIGKRWHDACRLMLDRDGYTYEQVEALVIWTQQHDFWQTTILSMPKLREKRLQLVAQLRRDHNGHRRRQEPASWATIREL
jgi:hypothetical protein